VRLTCRACSLTDEHSSSPNQRHERQPAALQPHLSELAAPDGRAHRREEQPARLFVPTCRKRIGTRRGDRPRFLDRFGPGQTAAGRDTPGGRRQDKAPGPGSASRSCSSRWARRQSVCKRSVIIDVGRLR
jgi:hypothetical protein